MRHQNEHLTQARALRADILAAPDIWLPRREVLLDWLNAFETEAPTPDSGVTAAADLAALDRFLRRLKVPVAA